MANTGRELMRVQMNCCRVMEFAIQLQFAQYRQSIHMHLPKAVKLWEEEYREYMMRFQPEESELAEIEADISELKMAIKDMFQFPDGFIL